MWFIVVEVEQETSAPPPKKNPGSAPAKRIQIHQSQITNHDLLNPLKYSVKMIDGREKRYRQLAFELHNSHVCGKQSKYAILLLFCTLIFRD